jgi:hypothetical protein
MHCGGLQATANEFRIRGWKLVPKLVPDRRNNPRAMATHNARGGGSSPSSGITFGATFR